MARFSPPTTIGRENFCGGLALPRGDVYMPTQLRVALWRVPTIVADSDVAGMMRRQIALMTALAVGTLHYYQLDL